MKIKIIAFSIFVVCAVGAYMLVNSGRASTGESITSDASSTVTIDGSNIVTNAEEGGYTVEQVPIESAPKAPPIERPLPFSGSFTESQKKDIQATADALQAKLVSNPKDAGAWTSLGTIRKIAGDYEGARLAWEYGTKLSPGNATPLYNLADLNANFLKNYSAAEKYYKQVIALNPQDTNPYSSLFTLYAHSLPNASAAEAILKQGIVANPDSFDLQVLLARYYAKSGRMAEAKQEYGVAVASAERLQQSAVAAQIQQEASAIQ